MRRLAYTVEKYTPGIRPSDMGDLTKNFSRSEFACKGFSCCGHSAPVTTELATSLQLLRDLCGEPLHVTSGFRCNTHNAVVGGAPESYHRLGMAADISCPHIPPIQLAAFAEQVPAFRRGGIILYDNWIHVDVRQTTYRGDKRSGK